MKKVLHVLVWCLLICFSVSSKASPIDEMQTFYQHKSESLAKAIIQDVSDKQILEKNNTALSSITGFIVGLLVEDPSYATQFKSMNLSSKMSEVIYGAEQVFNAAKGNIDVLVDLDILASSRPNKINLPGDFDYLWGLFSATGNAKIPENICMFLEKEASKTTAGSQLNLITMVAKWSLESQAKNHPIVKQSIDKLSSQLQKIP